MRPSIREVAPSLLKVRGVGFDVAAKLLIAAGDNPHRIRSEAAWAHLCGVAPTPASSGKIQHHRLNRGGNRQANSALYRIVLTRMSNDERTKTYVAKRIVHRMVHLADDPRPRSEEMNSAVTARASRNQAKRRKVAEKLQPLR